MENEVSTFDVSLEHETQGENYYDALDELDTLDPLENEGGKAKPIIFKTREGRQVELTKYPTPKQSHE